MTQWQYDKLHQSTTYNSISLFTTIATVDLVCTDTLSQFRVFCHSDEPKLVCSWRISLLFMGPLCYSSSHLREDQEWAGSDKKNNNKKKNRGWIQSVVDFSCDEDTVSKVLTARCIWPQWTLTAPLCAKQRKDEDTLWWIQQHRSLQEPTLNISLHPVKVNGALTENSSVENIVWINKPPASNRVQYLLNGADVFSLCCCPYVAALRVKLFGCCKPQLPQALLPIPLLPLPESFINSSENFHSVQIKSKSN